MFWGVQVEPGKQYTQVAVADIHISGACLGHTLNTKGGISGRTTLFIVTANLGGGEEEEGMSDGDMSDGDDMSGSGSSAEDDGGKSSSSEGSGSSAEIESGDSEMDGERAVFALATLVPGAVENATLSHHITEGETFTFFTSGKETVHVTGFYMIDDEEGGESSDEYRFRESDDESIDSELAVDAIAGSDSDDEDETFKPAGADDDDDEDDMDSDQDISSSEFDAIIRDAKGSAAAKRKGDSKKDEAPSAKKAKKESNPAETKKQKQAEAKKAKETPATAEAKKNKKKDAPKTPVESTPKPQAGTPKTPATPKKIKHKSGLEYVVTHPGRGKAAKSGARVQVHYTGRLTNGKVFDSSRRGRGKPFAFGLGRGEVIRGWDIGVEGMVVGEKRTLTIPPHLGYGSRGAPPDIPPNATLKFDVELVKA